MDNTETYIKMCNCKQIQKEWKPSMGDWTRITNYSATSNGVKNKRGKKEIFILDNQFDAEYIDHEYYDTIWLPRQDQIQEMVGSKTAELIDNFYWFCINEARNSDGYMDCIHDGDPEKINQKSMEQLWLSFVMKEKYQKTWDSEKEEWVK